MTITAQAVVSGGQPLNSFRTELTVLAEARTRAEAAAATQAMAEAADRVAAALAGTASAAPDTPRDPVAWTDIATYLTRLALALHSGHIEPADHWDFSDGDYGSWEDLAAAATRAEFAAAWYPIRETLLGLAAPRQDTASPPLRGFAVDQVIRVAAAAIDARW